VNKMLICFAHGKDGDWEGICLDFDIAVQGHSFEAVKALLDEAIETYTKDALAEDEDNARRLLSRKAPWHVRLSYMVRFFVATVLHRDDEFRHAFNVPCAA
jgi:predicted RNase H-like HicB family nuclease